MPDTFHQALEKHIDTQHPDLSRLLNSIADVKDVIKRATHNFENEPSGNPSAYSPIIAFMTDDVLREAALAGYCFSAQFPKSAPLSATTGVQYSIFNNGSKTVIIDQIDCTTLTAVGQFYLQPESSDPSLAAGTTFTGFVGTTNHKLSVGTGATGITATFTPTPFTTNGPTTFMDFVAMPANQTQPMFTSPKVIILPAGAKTGILITVISAGAAVVLPHVHMTELPF